MSPPSRHLLEKTRRALEPVLEDLGDSSTPPTLSVAWSGGLDSTALLDLLMRLRAPVGFELAAIHVDHGLHDQSERHAAFCRRVAARRGVALSVERLRLRDDTSPEAQARRQRYAAVASAARRAGSSAVATAHHADDAVETALLNWIRGTGSSGLANIAAPTTDAPVGSWGDLVLFRPLRDIPGEALREYAERRDLEWCRDPTNESREPTRNRIRRDVVPALTREAGGLEPLYRTLENLGEESSALRRRARSLLEPPGPGDSRASRRFRTAALAEAPRAEAAAALRLAARTLPGGPGWRRETLEETLDAVDAVDSGGSRLERIDLRGARATVEPSWTTLECARRRGGRDLEERTAQPIELDLRPSRGARDWFGWRLEWRRLEDRSPGEIPRDDAVAWFDADELPESLLLRAPAPGERFAPLGGPSSTAITEVLRAGDIPQSLRWRWPVVADPNREPPEAIVWVAGLRQSAVGRIDDATDRMLALELARREEAAPDSRG